MDEDNQFDSLMGMANPNTPTIFRQHLPQFLRFLATGMINNHRRFIDEDLDMLGAPWIDFQKTHHSRKSTLLPLWNQSNSSEPGSTLMSDLTPMISSINK